MNKHLGFLLVGLAALCAAIFVLDEVRLAYDLKPPEPGDYYYGHNKVLGETLKNAEFVSQTVPISMEAGRPYDVSVAMKNSGSAPWSPGFFRLGSQAPQDNLRWGLNRALVASEVQPGASYVFNFKVTAPSASGTYDFQWRMVEEGVQWFGGVSQNVKVTVTAPAVRSEYVTQSVPTSMVAGQSYDISVTMKNTGTSAWPASGVYRLGSQNPQDNMVWGFRRAFTVRAVQPNESYTFNLRITAPTNPGTYNFQWRMVQELVQWFGPATPNVAITVTHGVDQRFGLGGGARRIAELGIPWGNNFGIVDEENLFKPFGINTYFLVGMLSTGSTDFGSLQTLESAYLKDSEDRLQYDRLLKFLDNRPDQDASNFSSGLIGKYYIQSTYLLSANLAKKYPGSYFAIGNEEDWGPYMTPAEYADYYDIFYKRIKKYDPTAKVMIGGLVGFIPELVKTNEINKLGKETTSADKYAWIKKFRKAYLDKYGSYPQVDVWNIHPYVLLTFPVGTPDGGRQLSWQEAWQKIVDFKNFLIGIGEGDKQLWATEMGVGAMQGDLSKDLEEEWRIIAEDFMIPLLNQLKGSNYLDRWFWYGAYPSNAGQCQDQGRLFVECIYQTPGLTSGPYNPLGVAYVDSASNSILYNKGFEAAGTKPFKWKFWSEVASGYGWFVDDTYKHSEFRSLKLKTGSVAGSAGFAATAYQDISDRSLSGKRIRVSGWTKTSTSGQSGLIVSLGFKDGSASGYWRTSTVPKAGYSEWTKITTDWLDVPQNVAWVRVNCALYGQAAEAWFDDMSVEVN